MMCGGGGGGSPKRDVLFSVGNWGMFLQERECAV